MVASDQWDEDLRGKKMSEQTGLTIYKYQMPIKEEFTMQLPKDAQILRVADQDGIFWLWAMVDIRNEDETRYFRAFKCGAPIPDGLGELTYLGWCAIHVQQELALYLFSEKKDEASINIILDDGHYFIQKGNSYFRFAYKSKFNAESVALLEVEQGYPSDYWIDRGLVMRVEV